MNKKVKKLWLDALRSGEYAQAGGKLRTTEGFCCLGVLCDVHSKVTGKGKWLGEVYCTSPSQWKLGLPTDVQRWAGLDDYSPAANGLELSALNDDGVPFEWIAAVIEHEL